MPKRTLTDERARARDLFIHEGWQPADIASVLAVHINTIRNWIAEEDWEALRNESNVSLNSVVEELKAELQLYVKELREKHRAGESISDFTLKRIERLVKTITTIQPNYDEKGSILRAMRLLTDFLKGRNDIDALKMLHAILPDFYRSLLQSR